MDATPWNRAGTPAMSTAWPAGRQRRHEPTDRERAILLALDAGKATQAITKAMGVNRQLVYRTRIRWGRPCRRRHQHPPSFIRTAKALWREGLSISEIGRRMGVTRNVIAGISHRQGFPGRGSPIRRSQKP